MSRTYVFGPSGQAVGERRVKRMAAAVVEVLVKQTHRQTSLQKLLFRFWGGHETSTFINISASAGESESGEEESSESESVSDLEGKTKNESGEHQRLEGLLKAAETNLETVSKINLFFS
ncbi:unnamed protein product, partial [Timema podura]|nr:unnamed protein product [Timema podura]